MRRVLGVVCLVALLGLGATGCSGSDDDSAADVTTTTEAPITPVVYDAAATALCQDLHDAGGPGDAKALATFERKFKRIEPPVALAKAMEDQVWPVLDAMKGKTGKALDDAVAKFRLTVGGLGFDGCVQALS